MNKPQRIVLFLFFFLILVSDNSYSLDHNFKLLSLAILLFIGLSPSGWFSENRDAESQVVDSLGKEEPFKEEVEDQELEENNSLDESSLSGIGLPTAEKLSILKSLLKIRSAELVTVYDMLRRYQKKAGKGNWVALFMKEYGLYNSSSTQDLWRWGTVTDEKEKECETKALELFRKKYKFCTVAPTELYEDQTADLQVALSYWAGWGPKKVIKCLQEVKSFGFLEEKITEIIHVYNELYEGAEEGDFEAIFEKRNRNVFLVSQINELWSDVLRLLKIIVIIKRSDEAGRFHLNYLDIMQPPSEWFLGMSGPSML
jgi:hypothetical protein